MDERGDYEEATANPTAAERSKTMTIRLSKRVKLVNKSRTLEPILHRFMVLWVQLNGVPFSTGGSFARVFVNGRLLETSSFDRFGVVRFNKIRTLTNAALRIQIFDRRGGLFRTLRVPAGVEAFAVIG